MLKVAIKNVPSLFSISMGISGHVYGRRDQKKGMHLDKKAGPEMWQTFSLPKYAKDFAAI